MRRYSFSQWSVLLLPCLIELEIKRSSLMRGWWMLKLRSKYDIYNAIDALHWRHQGSHIQRHVVFIHYWKLINKMTFDFSLSLLRISRDGKNNFIVDEMDFKQPIVYNGICEYVAISINSYAYSISWSTQCRICVTFVTPL